MRTGPGVSATTATKPNQQRALRYQAGIISDIGQIPQRWELQVSEAEEPRKPRDITRLVLKAVKRLPEDEQRAVFEYFFEQGIALPQRGPSVGQFVQHAQPIFGAQKSIGAEQVTIPVRLSKAQHQRLKQWAAKHNFPMAVVVRGLIERFLDDWEQRTERTP